MKRFFARGCFPISAGIWAAVGLLAAPAPGRADIYTELPAALVGYDSSREIHIDSAAGAAAVRQGVVDYLWGGRGLPTALPTSTTVYTGGGTLPGDLIGLAAGDIASAQRWQANMDFNYSTSMYLLRPTNANANTQRLAIVQQGHASVADRFSYGIDTMTDDLLRNGFTVLALQMPLSGWNTQTTFTLPSGPANLGGGNLHDTMVSTLEGQGGGSALRFFVEPVIQGINQFVRTTPNYTDISMVGISGGGWTTTLAAAIDPRIDLSIPVAGSEPLYARPYNFSQGDAEQYLPAMYGSVTGAGGVASYLDLYTLGSTGPGRRQIQILNQYDNSCFYGVMGQTWVNNVQAAVGRTGSGTYDFYLDTTTHTHTIAPDAIAQVIDPALGVEPAAPPPRVIAPAPAIHEQFSAAGTPPPGWYRDPRADSSGAVSSSGGLARFSGSSDVISIVDNTPFNPQGGPITMATRISSIGADGYLGFFITDDPNTRENNFGLQLHSNGQLLLGSDPGGNYHNDLLTTLPGYQGGPITLTLTFDANGFTAATDFDKYSTIRSYGSLSSFFKLSDFGSAVYLYMQNFNAPAGGTVDWITVVPEPSSAIVLGIGGSALAASARPGRRKKD